jgi:hypothetical protein
MFGKPEPLITPYRCRWNNRLNAAGGIRFEPKADSSGAAMTDRRERCRSARELSAARIQLSYASTVVPFCSHVDSFRSPALPFESHRLSYASTALPFGAHGHSFRSPVLPFESTGLPYASTRLPFASNLLPFAHNLVSFAQNSSGWHRTAFRRKKNRVARVGPLPRARRAYFIPMCAAANAHSSARSAMSLSVGR